MSETLPPATELLDHGYVKLIETWGSDERIVESARMSTAKGFLGWGPMCSACDLPWLESYGAPDSIVPPCPNSPGTKPMVDCGAGGHMFTKAGDEKLLAFLWNNHHATPFEMAGAILEVKAPIFVFREWHRHRTQSYNEMSARYIPLPDENYIPSVDRLMINSKTNKQAGTIKGAEELTPAHAEVFRAALRKTYTEAEQLYQEALVNGVPKELARVHLPVGRYSCMRASANLRNWLAFLTLRQAPGAQWEIRQYAHAVHGFLAERFPRTMELFDAGR